MITWANSGKIAAGYLTKVTVSIVIASSVDLERVYPLMASQQRTTFCLLILLPGRYRRMPDIYTTIASRYGAIVLSSVLTNYKRQ
jgi:hypothetical protein